MGKGASPLLSFFSTHLFPPPPAVPMPWGHGRWVGKRRKIGCGAAGKGSVGTKGLPGIKIGDPSPWQGPRAFSLLLQIYHHPS